MKFPEEANPETQKTDLLPTGAEVRREWCVCVLLLKENMVFFWGAETFLKLKKGDCCTTL